MKKAKKKSAIISYRKTCKATGTGLSHYILTNRRNK